MSSQPSRLLPWWPVTGSSPHKETGIRIRTCLPSGVVLCTSDGDCETHSSLLKSCTGIILHL